MRWNNLHEMDDRKCYFGRTPLHLRTNYLSMLATLETMVFVYNIKKEEEQEQEQEKQQEVEY